MSGASNTNTYKSRQRKEVKMSQVKAAQLSSRVRNIELNSYYREFRKALTTKDVDKQLLDVYFNKLSTTDFGIQRGSTKFSDLKDQCILFWLLSNRNIEQTTKYMKMYTEKLVKKSLALSQKMTDV